MPFWAISVVDIKFASSLIYAFSSSLRRFSFWHFTLLREKGAELGRVTLGCGGRTMARWDDSKSDSQALGEA